MKKGKILFWVIFSGALLTGGIILWKKVFGHTDPNKRAQDAAKLASENPSEANVAAANEAKQDAALAEHTTPDAFPLKRGSRDRTDDFVKRLQLWLTAKFGASALPRYGADGIFGAEVEKALSSHGLPVVIDRAWFDSHVGAYEGRNKFIAHPLYAARGVINLYELNSMALHGTATKNNYLGVALSIDNPPSVSENFIVIDLQGKKFRARVEDVYSK